MRTPWFEEQRVDLLSPLGYYVDGAGVEPERDLSKGPDVTGRNTAPVVNVRPGNPPASPLFPVMVCPYGSAQCEGVDAERPARTVGHL